MKVLLLVPPEENYMTASIHKSLDHKREHRPLLGILSVATFLQQSRPQHEVKFVDCRALEMDFDAMARIVADFAPDVVGLTTLTFNFFDTLQTARRIKSLESPPRVVLGGWHVSLYPHETLEQPSVDFVVHGEGERSFVELIDAIDDGSPLGDILGIGFQEDDGAVVVTGSRKVDRELDDLPFPDFSLTQVDLYSHILGGAKITLPMESSRGCPFACTFCDIRRTQFRFRSPELIVDEMERWVEQGISSFFFVDDNVTVNKKRALKLFNTIADRGLNVEFKVSSRIDGLSPELMEAMVRAGVSRVSLGIESTKQKYLDYMQKETTVPQIVDCLAQARAVGLPVFAFMMLGLPGQTKQEMLEEADFLKRHKVDYASFSVMTVYPKTELYRRATEAGQLRDDPWPSFARDPRPNVQAPYMNTLYPPEELKKIQLAVTRRFYFSPRNLIRRIREVDSLTTFKTRAKVALRMLGREDVRL